MSEIEKMYENAGIEKEFEKPAKCTKNHCITCDGCMLYDDKKGKCNNRKDYPPFTAEKQLELIKKISPAYPLNYHIKCFQGYSFEEGLAKCINNLWQYLTEEKHKQIKEILE